MRVTETAQDAGRAARQADSHLGSAGNDTSRSDGRQLRGVRTRQAIFAAYLELMRDTSRPPRIDQVAQRAGVGIRTVYNQFRDIEGLRTEVEAELFRQWAVHLHGDVPVDAPRIERLRTFLRVRTRILTVMEPYARVAQGYHHSSPELQRQRDQLVKNSQQEISRAFAPELRRRRGSARTRLLNALHAASNWPAWSSLRDELGLDVDEAAAVMQHTIQALLDA